MAKIIMFWSLVLLMSMTTEVESFPRINSPYSNSRGTRCVPTIYIGTKAYGPPNPDPECSRARAYLRLVRRSPPLNYEGQFLQDDDAPLFINPIDA